MMGGYGDVQLLNDDGSRLDGRKVDEMRPVSIEAGVLPAADGSAMRPTVLTWPSPPCTDPWRRTPERFSARTEQ